MEKNQARVDPGLVEAFGEAECPVSSSPKHRSVVKREEYTTVESPSPHMVNKGFDFHQVQLSRGAC
jgi:hypothetical protein